ncbi:MAG: hypothetical protein KKA12_05170 [Alphaproteobacteria bacterium]|nr:hypothetical protein [Alphaproteobacteria bacterium]
MKVSENVEQRGAGLSLLFARGARPDADALASRAASSGEVVGFSVSHRPADHPYWVELLALGLTFDLLGLAPGIPAQSSPSLHAFATTLADVQGCDALMIRPGPHLSAGSTLLPVVRAMAALGCELAALPGLMAIGWEPAGTVMAPDYYSRVIGGWLKGGAFPALGLTALIRSPQGEVASDGLAFFTGYEIRLDPLAGEPPAEAAKLALRLIHFLVENGPYTPGLVEGPGGEALQCEYTANRDCLRIRRTVAARP